MILITTSLLVLLLKNIQSRYKWDAILHPAFWFASVWIMAIGCYLLIDAAGGVPISDPELLDNLMTMLAWTAILFWLFTFLPIRDQRAHQEKLYVTANFPKWHALFSFAGLAGASINWIALGANFSYNDDIRQQWLSEIPRITALMWYLYFLSFPAAFISGKILATYAAAGLRPRKMALVRIFTPLISALVWSIGTGGRQALGLMLFLFAVGGVFGIAWVVRCGYNIPRRRMIRLGMSSLGFIVMFSLFVGLTGLSRAKQQGSSASVFDDIWYLAPVGQLISYNGLTIATYQAYGMPVRRDLSETGPVSLAGLQYFGLRFLTGWRPVLVDDTNPERLLASAGQELASGTRNVFYDLQADFGHTGSFLAIAILVAFSQLLWKKTRHLGQSNILRTAPLVVAIMFWGYSHQFSLLMHNFFFWLVISFGLWDFSQQIIVNAFNQQYNSNQGQK